MSLEPDVFQRREIRFVLVGTGLFLFDTLVFSFVVWGLGVPPVWAQGISRTVASIAGFLWHRGWTFRHPDSAYRSGMAVQGVGFLGLTLANIVLSPMVLAALLVVLPRPVLLTKVLAEAVIVVESFLVLRLVFRHGAVRPGDEG